MVLCDHLEGRASHVYWRPWGSPAVNRRFQALHELLQVGLRLARPPDPPPPSPERQVMQRPLSNDPQDLPAIWEGMAFVLAESTMYSVNQPLSPMTLPSSGDEALPLPSPVYSNARTHTPPPPSHSRDGSFSSPSSVYSNVKTLTPQSSVYSNVKLLTPLSSVSSNVRTLTPASAEPARRRPRTEASESASAPHGRL